MNLPSKAPTEKPILELSKVRKKFIIKENFFSRLRISFRKLKYSIKKHDVVNVINEVSLKVFHGETFCLVGESGCGKSTLARLIMKLIEIDEGEIRYQGKPIHHLSRKNFLPYRSKIQMVFQNPYSSLNPRMTIKTTLEQPLKLHFPHLSSSDLKKRLIEVIHSVGLETSWLDRFPHEFSGGQKQRIGIARALMVSPEFLIADEPISALDVSIQSQIINLLKNLQAEKNLTYLFITHNLSVVKHLADRVCVMYLGVICEIGRNEDIFNHPQHPYTKVLLSSIPDFGKQVDDYLKVEGEITTPINLAPQGCVFAPRCPYKKEICVQKTPVLKQGTKNQVACHLV